MIIKDISAGGSGLRAAIEAENKQLENEGLTKINNGGWKVNLLVVAILRNARMDLLDR